MEREKHRQVKALTKMMTTVAQSNGRATKQREPGYGDNAITASLKRTARAAKASAPQEQDFPAPKGRKPAAGKASEKIVVPPLRITTTTVRVRGISEYIAHQFSEKAKQQMRDKHQKRARGEREVRRPELEYEAAKYKDDDGDDAIPTLAFKCAIVDAASYVQGITKVQLRGSVFVMGQFVKLQYHNERMREDVVRVGMGSADLRYRPEYTGWYVDLPIHFDADVISAEQLHHLIQRAGFGVGVGEWRPQKNGQSGRFELAPQGWNPPARTSQGQKKNGAKRGRRGPLHSVQ